MLIADYQREVLASTPVPVASPQSLLGVVAATGAMVEADRATGGNIAAHLGAALWHLTVCATSAGLTLDDLAPGCVDLAGLQMQQNVEEGVPPREQISELSIWVGRTAQALAASPASQEEAGEHLRLPMSFVLNALARVATAYDLQLQAAARDHLIARAQDILG